MRQAVAYGKRLIGEAAEDQLELFNGFEDPLAAESMVSVSCLARTWTRIQAES